MPAATLTVGNTGITAILDVDTSIPLDDRRFRIVREGGQRLLRRR